MVEIHVCTEVKDSGIDWIGYIPESWNVRTLYQLVTQVKNKNSELQEKNLLSLSYGKIKRKDIDSPEGLLPASFDGYNIIEAGDIVLRLTDLQNDHTSLRVGLATERGIITSAYTTLRPIKARHAKYIYYLLHAFDLKKGFYGMGSGVRQGLNYDEVKELRVVLPSDTEQDAITAYLDDQCEQIDYMINEAKTSIEEYKAWRASIIYEAVTKGLNSNAEMIYSGVRWIGNIPKDWKVIKTKYIICGNDGGIWGDEPQNDGNDKIVIRSTEQTIDGKWSIVDPALRDLSKINYKYYRIEPNDLLMTKSSGSSQHIGKTTLADDYFKHNECYFSNFIQRIRVTGIDVRYVWYLFNSVIVREQFVYLQNSTSGIGNINSSNIENVFIPLPPETEQKKIVSFLDERCRAIDEIINEKQALISDLESYKRSLIYEMVTGKRKVV